MTAGPPGPAATRATLGLALLFLLVPIVVAPLPPLEDYPNHLARFWLLAGGADLPELAGTYKVVWDALTNIGMDVVAMVATRWVGFETAGQLMVAAAIVLPPIGGAVLWRTVYGTLHWWMLSFALLAWSAGLLAGFLNFEIGLGLAMLAAAVEPLLAGRRPWVGALARAALAGGLLFVHAFAFAFYGALLMALAIGPSLPAALRQGAWRRTAARIGGAALALAMPALLFVLLAPSLPGRQTGTSVFSTGQDFLAGFEVLRDNLLPKLLGGLVGIRAYHDAVDALTLAALVAPVAIALLAGTLRIHAGFMLCGLALVVGYLLFPDYLAGTNWIDRRFAMMAPFAFCLAVSLDLPAGLARASMAILFSVGLLRTADVGWVWHARQADVAALRAALAAVPPGAAILPVQHVASEADFAGQPVGRFSAMREPGYVHMPTLAIPWRRASFVPILFAARGKQPLVVLPPWTAWAMPDGGSLPDVHALTDPALMADALTFARYMRDWQARYDYVLVLNADVPDQHGPFQPPAGLERVSDTGFAQVYRIVRPR